MLTAISAEQLKALEQTLHREIPLTLAMGITVVGFDEHGLTLAAPLASNLNDKRTAFGGSLAALATLAGWGLVHLVLRDHGPATVVIRESNVSYLRPVTRDIVATCSPPTPTELEKFLRTFERRGMARIELDVTIKANGEDAVRYHGVYVALDKARHPEAESI